MFKKYSFIILASLLASQAVFADMSAEDKSCEPIVKACLDAGFGGAGGGAKQFWMDCMEPLILGKTVAKTNVSVADVHATMLVSDF